MKNLITGHLTILFLLMGAVSCAKNIDNSTLMNSITDTNLCDDKSLASAPPIVLPPIIPEFDHMACSIADNIRKIQLHWVAERAQSSCPVSKAFLAEQENTYADTLLWCAENR